MTETSSIASRSEAECLGLLDQVAETGASNAVTKHGKTVAGLVPLEDVDQRSLGGSVTILTDDEDERFSTGEPWEAGS